MTASEPGDYFVLEAHEEDFALLTMLQAVGGRTWMTGNRFAVPVQTPLIVEFLPDYEESTLLSYYDDVPLMRNDVLACLRAHGVENIDAYDVMILNTQTGQMIGGYSAINIVGMVGAADQGRTLFDANEPSRIIDASIDSLVLDPNRTHGFQLFRLAEAVTAVVVHARIKRALEAAGFDDIRFVSPEHWMG